MTTLSRLMILGLLCGPALLTRAAAQATTDEVSLKDGTTQAGKVLAENYDALQLQIKKGTEKAYEWNLVASVKYAGAPAAYTEAMDAVANRPDEAVPLLQALAANEKLRDVLRQNAMMHLASLQRKQGQVAESVTSWQALVKAFPQGRFLGLAARGVVEGSLATGSPAAASTALETLARDAQAAKAPESFMAEVALLRGKILEVQGKFADARAAYEGIAKQAGASPEVLATAQLRTAECLKAEGKGGDAETRFQQIVGGEGSSLLMAGAWNGIADLRLEQGKSKRDTDLLLEALYAYLRGVVQYLPAAGEPTDEQERAIKGASDCFTFLAQLESDKERKADYTQRAKDELERLTKQFPNSKYITPK